MRRNLRAGPLTAVFEDGRLLHICWRGREVLHGIYGAVRDRYWGTVPLHLSGLRMPDCFHLTFQARHRRDEIDFAWEGSIAGDARGRLTFSFEGKALAAFARNRIGLCVLHAATAAGGKAFEVEGPEGTRVAGCFPCEISRRQPLPGTEAMRSLAWEPYPGLCARLQFEGDVFQMEDQRNWSDATFKIFSTPLEQACPVELAQGARVAQSVTLILEEKQPIAPPPRSSGPVMIGLDPGPAVPLPAIGLCLGPDPLTPGQIRRLATLRLAHLRADLRLAEPGWPAVLERATAEARELGCGLELAVFPGDLERELRALRGIPASRWLVFHPEIALARRLLDTDVPVGSGTDAGFFELGGFRPAAPPDFVCFSINPQAHASDDASLMETLPIQRELVETARRQAGLPVAVGPITLKPRPQQDARQKSPFAAAWTLGSVKYLSEAGAASVTYYETPGIMDRRTVFPLYHVFAALGGFAGGEALPAYSSVPEAVCAMVLRKGRRRSLLIANLTPRRQRVRVPADPLTLELGPYEVVVRRAPRCGEPAPGR